jgi:hypothetical protein
MCCYFDDDNSVEVKPLPRRLAQTGNGAMIRLRLGGAQTFMSKHEFLVELSCLSENNTSPYLFVSRQAIRRVSPYTVRASSPVAWLVVSPEQRGQARTD